MSRGNYMGGSTIIVKNNWSTHDPAETSDSILIKVHSKKNTKKKGKLRPSRSISKLQLMHLILDRHINSVTKFKLPKSMSQELIADVARCNSPLAWAKRQSSFEELKSKKLTKMKYKRKDSGSSVDKQQAKVRRDEKITQNRNRADYEERVAKVQENQLKAMENVEIIRLCKSKKHKIKRSKVKRVNLERSKKIQKSSIQSNDTARKDETKDVETSLHYWLKYQNALSGKKHLSKTEQQKLRKRRKLLRDKIYNLLPNLPEPPKGKTAAQNLKKELINNWKNTFDLKTLSYWEYLTPQEQNTYISQGTDFGAFLKRTNKPKLRKIRKVVPNKETKQNRTGINEIETSAARRMIHKLVNKRRTDTWDHKKEVDWDIT